MAVLEYFVKNMKSAQMKCGKIQDEEKRRKCVKKYFTTIGFKKRFKKLVKVSKKHRKEYEDLKKKTCKNLSKAHDDLLEKSVSTMMQEAKKACKKVKGKGKGVKKEILCKGSYARSYASSPRGKAVQKKLNQIKKVHASICGELHLS